MPLPKNWKLKDILVLSYYKGLPSDTLKTIVNKYSSFENMMKSKLPDKLSAIINNNELFTDKSMILSDNASRQLEICSKNNYKIITFWDDNYPKLLKKVDHSPTILFVRGMLQDANATSISIVGTRQCSTYGKLTADRFASYFARNKIIVCSGMAYGIDTCSHLSTVKANGVTYAVIASGLNSISHSVAEKIASKIVDYGGAIITEYKCGTKALPAYFPQRNRIISGISLATLVIESEVRGGSLITAQFAFNQSREVFAVPGNINSIKSSGTNNLIKNHEAIPALCPEDMLNELGYANDPLELQIGTEMSFSSPLEKVIYNILNHEPMHIDEIAEKSNVEISDIIVKLLNMEFDSIVRQLPGKHYVRAN